VSVTLFKRGRDAPAEVPVLPNNDPRLAERLVWAEPLSQRLIHLINEGKGWDQIDARLLEEIVAELFAGFGYEVELTKRTRDGGRDVIAIRHSMVKDDKYLIECKHWTDKVGIGVVRELLGVGATEPNSGLILASTSGFTSDARLLADREQVRWSLALKDRDDIDCWVESYARQRGWL
jgi:predicted Mrr-cat superfamily restriction endonuclease